jgi:hypothetical protein
MRSTLRNEGTKEHFWREFEKWHHVKVEFEFEFDLQVLVLDKISNSWSCGPVRLVCGYARFAKIGDFRVPAEESHGPASDLHPNLALRVAFVSCKGAQENQVDVFPEKLLNVLTRRLRFILVWLPCSTYCNLCTYICMNNGVLEGSVKREISSR